MFARLPDADAGGVVAVTIDGVQYAARSGDTVAAALLAAGVVAFRVTSQSGAVRGPYCLMGACFECLVEIDGAPNRQACMTRVAPGMRIATRRGAPEAKRAG